MSENWYLDYKILYRASEGRLKSKGNLYRKVEKAFLLTTQETRRRKVIFLGFNTTYFESTRAWCD